MGGNVEIQPRETTTKRRRFKSWMNWRRMFQRKAGNAATPVEETQASKGHSSRPARLAGVFSRSTGELISADAESQPIPISAEASGDGFLGLSVSHDSVFGLDASPSGSYPNRQQRHQESLPSSASLQYMSELRAAIGIRRRSTDEDEGFPRSPVNVSPSQIISHNSLHHTPVHAGSGSDPSLLSLNSCDFEEVFPSLPARSPAPQQHLDTGRAEDDGLPGIPAAPLNHSAARHKISVRPKRNHAPARVRQLPQLAEDTGIAEDTTDEPERKPRALHSTQQHLKPRSVSLSRTEDSSIKEAPIDNNAGNKPSAGSSTTKLARSKSSVEKKIQHEVAVFWRKTKEALRKESRDPSQESPGPTPASSESEMKRKDLRKIKRDKEEKRKRSETQKDEPSPPFLSRIFGSRRSGRRVNKKPSVPDETPPSTALAAQVEPMHPLPKPRTVFTPPQNEDEDVDWRLPHQPYSFAPPPSKVLPPVRQPEEWVEEEQVSSAAPSVSPLPPSRSGGEISPLPARHRIHIAGLSPYQRRVARIGNGLEISDEEWDQSSPVQPRRLDTTTHSNVSLENCSLPVHINHDFILKRASPVREESGLGVSENIRRSLDILKFSNEGLKKTIDSLNNQRMSQSSDQLHLSDGSLRRQSTGSRSNSTSSLNISDADDLADIGSAISLDHSSGYEKDVRDDVLIIDDHKETIEATVWPRDVIEPFNPPSPLVKSGANTPTANKSGSSSPISPITSKAIEAPSSQAVPEFLQVQLNHVTSDSQQKPAAETPMFSMSVRVQNPPEAKFRRSSSGETALPTESSVAAAPNEPPKPFVASVRTRTEEDAPSAHQLMARLSARPWQSKEDKERQNKVLLDRSQSEPAGDGSASDEAEPAPDVRLRPKKPVEETSELLKVFARRSLKLRGSRDLSDADESISVRPADESVEAPKERVSSRWKPPIAARETVPLKRPSKSVPFIRVQESHVSLDHADQSSNGSPTSAGSKSSSPTGAQVEKFFGPSDDVWKKQPSIKSRFERFNQPQPVKAEEAKPTPAVRQSKVLDMVHNFQRLQVT